MTQKDVCVFLVCFACAGDVPEGFHPNPDGQTNQFSWSEGNDLKLFGCQGYCNGHNCINQTSGLPHAPNPGKKIKCNNWFEPFPSTMNRTLAKTGSGQTRETLKRKGRFLAQVGTSSCTTSQPIARKRRICG